MNGVHMAMISCPECKTEISDQAAACPKCGFARKENKVTIQQSSKKYKLMLLAAWLLIIVGFLSFKANAIFSFVCLGLGAVLLVWSRVGKWWNND